MSKLQGLYGQNPTMKGKKKKQQPKHWPEHPVPPRQPPPQQHYRPCQAEHYPPCSRKGQKDLSQGPWQKTRPA